MTHSHSKLFAHELTRRRASDEADRLALALANAQADVNPHQVDAALFAFQTEAMDESKLTQGFRRLACELSDAGGVRVGLHRRRCGLVSA